MSKSIEIKIIEWLAERDSLEKSPPEELEVVDQVVHVLGTKNHEAPSLRYIFDTLYGADFSDKHWQDYRNILIEYGLAISLDEDSEEQEYFILTPKGKDIHQTGGWLNHLKLTSTERINVSPKDYERKMWASEKKNSLKKIVKHPGFPLFVTVAIICLIAYFGWMIDQNS